MVKLRKSPMAVGVKLRRTLFSVLSISLLVTAMTVPDSSGTDRAFADSLQSGLGVPFANVIIDASPPNRSHVKAAGDIDGDGFPDTVIGGAWDEFQEGLFWYRFPTWEKFTIVPPGVAGFTTEMQMADVDNDGDLDILVPHGNFNGVSVHWYENPRPIGDPTVDTWVEHTIGTARAHDIKAGDIDGDGDLDVLVRGVATNGETTVFIQTAPDTWVANQINVLNGEGADLGDIDGDGDLDVAITGRWLENPGPLGDASLDPWTEYVIDLNWSEDTRVRITDINADGKMDVFFAPSESAGGRLSWYEADDPVNGPWTEHVVDPSVEYIHSIVPGDFNLDGDLDIATSEMHQSADPDEVSIYYGDGQGRNWVQQILSESGSHNMTAIDIGSDGDLDLIGANWDGSTPFEMWENLINPPLALDQFKRRVIDAERPWRAAFVTNGDINGDGYEDIITGGWWYENPGGPTGTWKRRTIGAPLNNMATVFDFDSDGDLDVLGTESHDPSGDPSAVFHWAQNNGTGTFTILSNIQVADGNFLQGVAVERFQPAGPLQVALSWQDATKGIQMLTVGTDPAVDTWTWELISTTGVGEDLTAGDIDGDADIDLMLGHEWLRNDGATWTVFTTGAVPLTNGPDRNELADINNDGRLDVVVGSSQDGVPGELVWYEQPLDPTGVWPRHDISLTVIGGGMSIDVADMDLDGDLDVIAGEHDLNTANAASLRQLVFENLDGVGGAWAEHVASTGDEHHDGSQTIDIDGDGDRDIISIGWSHNDVLLYENKAVNVTLSLDQWQRFVIDPDKLWRAVFVDDFDLDGDGLPDIVTGGWWYKNPGLISGNWQRNIIGAPLNNMAVVYDFDGDGDLDVLGTQGQGSVDNSDFAWAQNDGAGNFTIFTNVESGVGRFLQGATVNRFNVGGPIEVALSWQNSTGSVQMLTVPADPTTGIWTWRELDASAGGEGLDSGDIDNDGDIDILVGSSDGVPAVQWLRNEGASTYTLLTLHLPATGQPDRTHLVDMDDDGDLDAVVGYGHDPVGTLAWYEQGTDPAALWTEHLVANLVNPQSVDIGDVDRDGDIDISVGEHNLVDPTLSQLLIYENGGAGLNWIPHVVYVGDEHHDAAILSDLEFDGDLDLISLGWTHSRVQVYSNLSTAAGIPLGELPPVAADDVFLVEQDVAVNIPAPGVLGNDSDLNGDPLAAFLDTDVTNGTLILNLDGSFTYTPNAGFTGTDSFTYKAHDGGLFSGVATVTLTIKPPSITGGVRVTDGLLALYEFQELSGQTIFDVSGSGAPLNLTIADPAAVSWVPGGLSVNSPTILASVTDASKITSAALVSEQITVEAWVKPANTVQNGPARIVTLSRDLTNRNFTLGQGVSSVQPSDRISARLRTTATSANGTPSTDSPAASLGTVLTHVVFTRNAAGETRVYIDGVESVGQAGGTFGTWDPTYKLALADELIGGREWLGEFQLVAIYDRAITTPEVNQNLAAGPDGFSGAGPAISQQPADQAKSPGEIASFSVVATGTGVLTYQWQRDSVDIPGATGPSYDTDVLALADDGSLFSVVVTDDLGTVNSGTALLTVHLPNDPPVAVDDSSYAIDEDVVLVKAAVDGVLANDTDADIDPLTAVLVTDVSNGTLTLSADGSFTYTPVADFNGIDSFTYQASDGIDLSNIATVTITVNAVNDPPVADDKVVVTAQDVAVAITLTGSDVDLDTLTFTLLSSPANGILSGSAPNLTYTPTAGFTGADSFTFEASDGLLTSNIATVSITVQAPDSDLIGYWSFDAGTALDNSGNGNDGVVVGAVADPGHNSTGGLHFDGIDDRVELGALDVKDGTGGQIEALTVTAWVRPDLLTNCGSWDCRIFSKATGVSTADHYIMVSTIRDGSVAHIRFRLKTNGITSTLVANAGALTNGVWSHVAAVYTGSEMQIYVDGVLVGSTAKTGLVDVNSAVSTWIGGNPPGPTDRPWNGAIDEVRLYRSGLAEAEIVALAGQAPPPDTTPPVRSSGAPTGTLPAGTTQATLSLITNENATCRYGTVAGTGFASLPGVFTTTGTTSHSMLVTGLVDGAAYDYFVRCEDTAVPPNANTNDFQISFSIDVPDTTPPSLLSYAGIGILSPGTTQATLSVSTDEPATCRYGTVAGTAYASLPNVFMTTGNLEHSTLVTGLSDGGAYQYFVRCEDAAVPANANPDDLAISFSVSAGIHSPAPSPSLVGSHPDAVVQPTVRGKQISALFPWEGNLYLGYGDWQANTGPIHIVHYDPVSGLFVDEFALNTESVQNFRGIDGKLYVPAIDRISSADADFAVRASDGTWTTQRPAGLIHAFDVNTLTGTDLWLVGSTDPYGQVYRSIDGGVSWTQEQQFAPSTTFTRVYFAGVLNGKLYVEPWYGIDSASKVFDGTTWSDGPELLGVGETGWRSVEFAGYMFYRTDQHPDMVSDLRRFDGTTSQITVSDVRDYFVDGGRMYVLVEDGTIHYTTDGVTYSTFSAIPDPTYRSIAVLNGVLYVGTSSGELLRFNTAPVASDDAYGIDEDVALVNAAVDGVLANDKDAELDPLTAVLVSDVSNGTLALNADGSFTYTPVADFNGVDSFTYRASDGLVESNIATVTITVNPVNDGPVADDKLIVTAQDVAVAITLSGSDVDLDTLTFTVLSFPANGILSGVAPNLTYTPDAGVTGTYSFTYEVTDGLLTSNIATVSITVTEVNDAPVAVDDSSYVTDEDVALVIAAPGVLANDTDADFDPLTAVLVTDVSKGTLTLNTDGSFTYTPALDFNGVDSFTYRASDGFVESNIATVTITVNAINDAPVAVDDGYATDEDTALVIAAAGVLVNDTDVDGNPLTAVLVTDVSNGTLTLNADGSFTYTPVADFNGIDSFTYRASDGVDLSNIATVTITVNAVNDPPVAVDDGYATDEDVALVIAAPGVLANDTDADIDPLTAVLVTDVSNGTLTLNADGSFTYTPALDFNGIDSFTYRASDGIDLSNIATVTITVNAVNDAPVADDQSVVTAQDVAVAISLTGSDVDLDTLTFTPLSSPANGILSGSAPNLTYTPNALFTGSDSFTYQASDGLLTSNIATVSITVQAPDSDLIGYWSFDAGTAVDDSGNGNDGVVVGAVADPGHNGSGGLDFDGIDDRVDLGTLDVKDGTGGQVQALTVTAWVRSDLLTNCDSWDCRIFSKAIGVSEDDHYIMVSTIKSHRTTYLRFRLKTNGTTSTLIANAGAFTDGVWSHVAAVYTGSEMQLYVDGVLVGSTAKTGLVDVNDTVSTWIGGNPPGPTDRPWNGSIDEVRLYRVGLTPEEIQLLAAP